MAWSYSGDPASSSKDKVRFLIGDTISADELLQDEEINAVIADQPNTTLAAAISAEAIAAKFSREATRTVGKTSISASEKAKAYLELARKLRLQSKTEKAFKARPYAGGISENDKKIDEQDTDRADPFFERNLFENPSSSPVRRDDDEC